MSIFTREQIAELNEIADSVSGRTQRIVESYLARQWSSKLAEEYAIHGFSRRMGTLRHCIEQIYLALPPDFPGLPDRDRCETATVNLQAFVFNAFGALDNLAFVWVYERNVRATNGRPLPNSRIGFSADKTRVRASLPEEFRTFLEECDEWFKNLEAFRHSLGHRIPLYIPPFTLPPDKATAFNALGEKATIALRSNDLDEYKRIVDERDALCRFRPWMQHSLYSDQPVIVFHSQVLADFATVELLGQKMLEALSGSVPYPDPPRAIA